MTEPRLSTRLDRYPAKMVGRLAEKLVTKYASNATSLLDPFCGSGAILLSGKRKGIPVAGVDLNPIGHLFCDAKINGFSGDAALTLCDRFLSSAKTIIRGTAMSWDAKTYWFTPATIEKFERLRAAAIRLRLSESPEGRAVLLALVLSVRVCSRADQRSPKPFISKDAIQKRRGRHFCPYRAVREMLRDLVTIYGQSTGGGGLVFVRGDISNDESIIQRLGKYSHVITSPPYLNAQDYFRNFKLELHVLENILPFDIGEVRDGLIGTERGDLLGRISKEELTVLRKQIPSLPEIAAKSERLEQVVIRYCHDMGRAFDTIRKCIKPSGFLVLVCADNLIAGTRFPTWRVLQKMLEIRGFDLVDSFTDQIRDRMLAPRRSGHKGIIKEEVISAFRLS
jgi:hypothetical protein